MNNQKFSIYAGKFTCQTCKEEVRSMRLWKDSLELTWMCTKKHLSKAQIKMTKKDYERKERE